MKANVILIDFENVQGKDLGCLRARPFLIKVFCGANQTKVPLDLAAQLQPLGENAEYVPIHGTGHNALDFHIAFYIGRLSAELVDAAFYIVSKDEGFDPLIQHLSGKGITCWRVASFGEIPGIVTPAPLSLEERIEKTAENLLGQKVPRPRTRERLLAFIKSHLNGHGSESALNAVMERLTQRGFSIQPDGRLSWP